MNFLEKNSKRQKIHSSIDFHDSYMNIGKIIQVLNKATFSTTDYDSTQQPFFSSDSKKNTFDFPSDIQSVINNIPISFNDYVIPTSLNRNIIFLYQLINKPKSEVYLGDWTILSLEEALRNYNNYCKDGQNNVFDIGFKYRGMGHITLISCDLKSHLLFYRNDGGSNGYDREANYQHLIKNGSDNYDKFFFSKWFFNIIND
jgi:hypothetical protein